MGAGLRNWGIQVVLTCPFTFRMCWKDKLGLYAENERTGKFLNMSAKEKMCH